MAVTEATPSTCDAVIVGAGIAGCYQLHRLRQLGLDVRVIEAADDVGGTWWWNRYPGARCDVESLSYSYSFSPELEQEWTWTEKYPTQPEILRYVSHVADRFDLRRSITFSTRVTSATWDETTSRWRAELDDGTAIDSRWLIMATGCLSVPKELEVPGVDTFAGPVLHTGRWPHEPVDLTGLRVGVIGTGSSGIQSIPLIAEQAADLTVFQRTPNFSMPAGNRPLDPAEITSMKATYPEWRDAQRRSGFGVPVEVATEGALQVSEDVRRERYQSGWDRGDLVSVLGSFTDTLLDPAANDTAAEFIRTKIRDAVDDPDVAEALSPRTYPFGTKRPCLDSGYYRTFNQGHVHLVDLRDTPLVEITAEGIRTSERTYAVDVIILATGFDAMTGALLAVDIRGVGGRSLREKWSSGPRTYLGLAVADFPNLFTVTGPTSPSVLSNMIVSIEQHVEWITDCIAHVEAAGTTIEATEAAEDAWVDHAAEMGSFTLFPKADSWYMGANVPGKPRVFLAYIGGVGAYREHCEQIAAKGYEGFVVR